MEQQFYMRPIKYPLTHLYLLWSFEKFVNSPFKDYPLPHALVSFNEKTYVKNFSFTERNGIYFIKHYPVSPEFWLVGRTMGSGPIMTQDLVYIDGPDQIEGSNSCIQWDFSIQITCHFLLNINSKISFPMTYLPIWNIS